MDRFCIGPGVEGDDCAEVMGNTSERRRIAAAKTRHPLVAERCDLSGGLPVRERPVCLSLVDMVITRRGILLCGAVKAGANR
jgi:hypothetical protein